MKIILASASPRRKELLKLITQNFEVLNADVDENISHKEAPAKQAVLLANKKAAFAFEKMPDACIIACDTIVEFDGIALGKPKSEKEARNMLNKLSGNKHFVHTGVSVIFSGNSKTSFCETSTVTFANISKPEIDAYVKTSEAYDKAGGYGIQGAAAKWAVRIEGCYYNIMGLPVAHLYAQLKKNGVL
jgi:septum formation protein